MGEPKVKPYPRALKRMMDDKTHVLSKAQAFSEMGLDETAQPLWESAGAYEEQIAPLLDILGRELEAALHRVSAASCYEKAGDPSRAANLFRAALAGPISDETRWEIEKMLAACLAQIARSPAKAVLARKSQPAATGAT